MSRGPDATTLVERALEAHAAAAGVALRLTAARATRWASATFVGARHTLSAELAPDDAGEGWLAALPEAELPLRGHLVADLVVVSRERDAVGLRAEIELLTVEER